MIGPLIAWCLSRMNQEQDLDRGHEAQSKRAAAVVAAVLSFAALAFCHRAFTPAAMGQADSQDKGKGDQESKSSEDRRGDLEVSTEIPSFTPSVCVSISAPT
jgi:hypothetical protein